MADGTPRYIIQGGKTPEGVEFVNPFQIPNKEGFAKFIKHVALAYNSGDRLSTIGVVKPYGEKITDFIRERVFCMRFGCCEIWDGYKMLIKAWSRMRGSLCSRKRPEM